MKVEISSIGVSRKYTGHGMPGGNNCSLKKRNPPRAFIPALMKVTYEIIANTSGTYITEEAAMLIPGTIPVRFIPKTPKKVKARSVP